MKIYRVVEVREYATDIHISTHLTSESAEAMLAYCESDPDNCGDAQYAIREEYTL